MVNFGAEAPTNLNERTLCVMLLDVSGSMQSDNRIGKLNNGLKHFYEDIKANDNLAESLEIAIIAYDHQVLDVVTPSLVDEFELPLLETRNGATDTAAALLRAIETVNDRKEYYRHHGMTYKRPWIILMTDGDSTSGDANDAHAVAQIRAGMDNKRFHYFPIGISLNEQQMQYLQQFAHPLAPALPLKGLNFSEFFEWLSNSLEKVSTSKDGEKVTFDSPGSWLQGYQV